MAYLGARGATAAAMARVLQLPAAGPGLVAGLRARRALLASLNRPGVTFAESNRLWTRSGTFSHGRRALRETAGGRHQPGGECRIVDAPARRSDSRVPQVDLIAMPGPAEVQCPAPWSRKINVRRTRAIGQYPASEHARAI